MTVQWLGKSVLERAHCVTADDRGQIGFAPPDGWGKFACAAISEGECPACLSALTPCGPGPEPEITAAGGECHAGDCPAAPCRWRAYRDGASMWRPLAPWPESYPA